MTGRHGLTRRALVAAGATVLIPGRTAFSQGCTRVELYPGYPGYRGIVTGLAGPGDTACLESLEAAGFSAADEDRQNAEAARRLGIAGAKEIWTWENWMAIEAERGMLPSCIMCLDLVGTEQERRTNRVVRADDPRILSGSWSTGRLALTWAASELGWSGLPGNLVLALPDDITLRAIVGLGNPGLHLNAEQFLEAYPGLVEAVAEGGSVNTQLLSDTLGAQGGHAPVPRTAHPDDQILMWETATVTLSRFMHPSVQQAYLAAVANEIDGWINELGDGSPESLAEYMAREAGRS